MSAEPSALLTVSDLRVRIGARELLTVTELSLPVGLTVIHGDAGSGKTLLAAALCGSAGARVSGTVRLAGRVLSGLPSRRVRLGLAAAVRDGERLTGCSVGEALALADRDGERTAAVLDRLPQLASRTDVSAGMLSGGEQQLLQFACAWASHPRVLVLDSPTVGLAADAAQAVRGLAEDSPAHGTAVLWLEQDLRDAPADPRHRLVDGQLASGASAPEEPSGPAAASPPEPPSRS